MPVRKVIHNQRNVWTWLSSDLHDSHTPKSSAESPFFALDEKGAKLVVGPTNPSRKGSTMHGAPFIGLGVVVYAIVGLATITRDAISNVRGRR